MVVPPSRLVALACLLALFGCDRAAQTPPAARAQSGASPRATIDRLMAARDGRDFTGMQAFIVPERAADVIGTLVSVHDFLSANDRLCGVVQNEVGIGLSESIDRSYLAYNLDIFSKYVTLLDENVAGDSATVGFTVDGELPARHAQLRRIDGTWRYDPGPGDYRRLADAFERMARGLNQVADEIKNGRLAPQRLRDNPGLLDDEVRLRLLPGMKMLPPAPASAGGGG